MEVTQWVEFLLLTSTVTSLIVEALKKVLNENNMKYKPNTLAGIVSAVCGAFFFVGGQILQGNALSLEIGISAVCGVVLSWLCSMLGYDKVMQTILQFKKGE